MRSARLVVLAAAACTLIACGSAQPDATARQVGAVASQSPSQSPSPSASPSPSPSLAAEPIAVPTTNPPIVVPTTPKAPGKPPTTKPAAPRTTKPAAAYYKNCDAAKAAGAAPLYRGQPGYRAALDRDGDGVACEN